MHSSHTCSSILISFPNPAETANEGLSQSHSGATQILILYLAIFGLAWLRVQLAVGSLWNKLDFTFKSMSAI